MSMPIAMHYARLGLAPGASRAELSAAYRAAAMRVHPDKGGDAVAFAAVRESYEAILAMPGHSYTPASIRTYGQRSWEDWNGIWALMGSVVFPTAIGLGVGIRLMYVGGERRGLRAGGTSRVSIPPGEGPETPEPQKTPRVAERSAEHGDGKDANN